ncbi:MULTISPECIES: hypothetical protein [Actinokineospora]|uniref:AAA+ ATPase domain-containing protein n=1 Tax=Actinokineospora fastidiosa TaxID=1816 RepID=A0A918GPQ6_9PSEU|nr:MULTISPECIES: hypothetical protein [Actinokineospora]UVS81211.1 hypothetical protein Actkin_04968 [Actinokineospora sp. UTMC 2448]GGS52088.1 hypothetical protein GCM10010171_53940 [Actinokineospora fastidiosa]
MIRVPMNPFALPGVEFGLVKVLRPHEDHSQDDLYVDVCGSHAAYQAFRTGFDVAAVTARGGFLLVVGDSGCGKTAVVNRCVHHMLKTLDGVVERVVVENLDRLLPSPFDQVNQLSIQERIKTVCNELFHVLDSRGVLYNGELDGLDKAGREKGHLWALRRLPESLKPNTAVIVHLPTPGDLVDEITSYAYSATSPGVVFVTETSSLQREHLDHLRYRIPSDSAPPVIVSVQRITADEIRAFIADRLTRCAATGIFPSVDKSGLAYLADHSNSIRRVQELCFRAYQARLDTNTDYTEDDVVTDGDFAGALGP